VKATMMMKNTSSSSNDNNKQGEASSASASAIRHENNTSGLLMAKDQVRNSKSKTNSSINHRSPLQVGTRNDGDGSEVVPNELVMRLRPAYDVLPRFDQLHMHMKKHLARCGVSPNTLLSRPCYYQTQSGTKSSTNNRKKYFGGNDKSRVRERRGKKVSAAAAISSLERLRELPSSGKAENNNIKIGNDHRTSRENFEQNLENVSKGSADADEESCCITDKNSQCISNIVAQDGANGHNTENGTLRNPLLEGSNSTSFDFINALTNDGEIRETSLVEALDEDINDDETPSFVTTSSVELSDVEMNPLDTPRDRRGCYSSRESGNFSVMLPHGGGRRSNAFENSRIIIDIDSEDLSNPGNLRLMDVHDDVIFLSNYLYSLSSVEKSSMKELVAGSDKTKKLSNGQTNVEKAKDGDTELGNESSLQGLCSFQDSPNSPETQRCLLYRDFGIDNHSKCDTTLFGSTDRCKNICAPNVENNDHFSSYSKIRRRRKMSVDGEALDSSSSSKTWAKKVISWILSGGARRGLNDIERKEANSRCLLTFDAPALQVDNMLKENFDLAKRQHDYSSTLISSRDKLIPNAPVEVTVQSFGNKPKYLDQQDKSKNPNSSFLKPNIEEISTPSTSFARSNSSHSLTSLANYRAPDQDNVVVSNSRSKRTLHDVEFGIEKVSRDLSAGSSKSDSTNNRITMEEKDEDDKLLSSDTKDLDLREVSDIIRIYESEGRSESFVRKYGCRFEDFIFLTKGEQISLVNRGKMQRENRN